MSGITVNTLQNANIYLAGASLLGKAEEFKLPTVKFKMVDHKAVGMIGSIKLPSGIEPLEGEIKWNSFYADVWSRVLNPYAPVELQARGSLETYAPNGRIAQVPYVVFLMASFYEVPLGDFKQNDKAEFQSKFQSNYIKQRVNNVDILEIDAMANIYKVNGIDQLDVYRQNLGG